jgi:hypothetical protein
MTVALSGAVIIEEKGSQITYKNKCEKCGWVSNSTVSGSAPMRNSTTTSYFMCTKCKNNQKVTLQGT